MALGGLEGPHYQTTPRGRLVHVCKVHDSTEVQKAICLKMHSVLILVRHVQVMLVEVKSLSRKPTMKYILLAGCLLCYGPHIRKNAENL